MRDLNISKRENFINFLNYKSKKIHICKEYVEQSVYNIAKTSYIIYVQLFNKRDLDVDLKDSKRLFLIDSICMYWYNM